MGRVYLCEQSGLKLKDLEAQDVVMPVASMNVKYKQSAKLDDEIIIKTKITEHGRFYIDFSQEIIDKSTKKTYIEALFRVVAIHKDGSLYRSLPKQLENLFV